MKETRPNFRHYLRTKVSMKVRVTDLEFKELEEIAIEEGVFWKGGEEKRLSGVKAAMFFDRENDGFKYAMSWCFWDSEAWDYSEHRKYNPKTDTLIEKVEEPKPIKTVGIDNSDVTLAQHEHVKDCPANSEIPKPVKFEDEVPEYVYIVYASVIRCYVVIGGFKKVIDKNLDGSIRETFTIYAVPMTEERGEWLDAKGCYRTLEEAVIVAKKLWNGEAK